MLGHKRVSSGFNPSSWLASNGQVRLQKNGPSVPDLVGLHHVFMFDPYIERKYPFPTNHLHYHLHELQIDLPHAMNSPPVFLWKYARVFRCWFFPLKASCNGPLNCENYRIPSFWIVCFSFSPLYIVHSEMGMFEFGLIYCKKLWTYRAKIAWQSVAIIAHCKNGDIVFFNG